MKMYWMGELMHQFEVDRYILGACNGTLSMECSSAGLIKLSILQTHVVCHSERENKVLVHVAVLDV